MAQLSISQANRVVFENVEGWVGDRIWSICQFLKNDQDAHSLKGSIAEIGVHHGKLFFLISHIGNENTPLIAIDLFEDQDKNVDGSGKGSREVFERHLTTCFPGLAGRTKVVSADSMSLCGADLSALFADRVRIFSIDGGHTVAHVVNDLSIAHEVLVSRGCIMLDDFFGPVWPSVTEGFFRFMTSHNRRLAPYLIFQNKLFLTTFSEQAAVLSALRGYLDLLVGDEIHSERWRYSTLCDFKVLCFS